jgi:hypothetical protein
MSTIYDSPLQRALTVLVFLACTCGVAAQTNVLESDPLSARRLIIYDQVGAYAGMVFNGQGGTIVSECNCEFTGGAATGFAGGFMFEKLTRSQFYWGVTFGYENRSVTGQFREIEGVVQTAPNGRQYTVPITFMNEADVSLHLVTLAPYLKYEFFNLLFAKAGVGMSYVFSSNLIHTKTLESTEVTFPNGETASVYLPDAPSGSVELQNGPIENLNPFQISAQLGVGLDLRLGKKVFLSPVFQYVQPLTSMNSGETTFSVRSFQIFFEGRLIL